MTIEEQVAAALQGLAGGQVFPDMAPEQTVAPYIVYQVVGGEPTNYLTGDAPGKTNARVQVAVWAGEPGARLKASQLGEQVESAVRAVAALQPEVLTGRMSTFDEVKKLRGTIQDFSVWY